MPLKVQQVPLEYVNQTWDYVEPFIEAALEFSAGDYNIEEVRVMVSLGSWQLIVATDEDNTIHGA